MLDNLLDQVKASTSASLKKYLLANDEVYHSSNDDDASQGNLTFDFIDRAFMCADLAILLLSGFTGFILRFGSWSPLAPADHLFIYLTAVVTVLSLHSARSYDSRNLLTLNAHLSKLLVAGINALFVILLCGYFSGKLHDYSRIWVASSVIIAVILLVLNRIAVAAVVQSAIEKRKIMEPIVIVGANEHAEKMITTILREPNSGVNILGVFDDRMHEGTDPAQVRYIPLSLNTRILGSTDELRTYIRCHRVRRVVVALPWITSERINELLKKLRTVPVRIDLVPNDVIWQFSAINMERLGGVPVLNIVNGRIGQQGGLVKRMEDLIITILLLPLIAPILLLISLVIKLDSKGPVIFKQRRHGYNNKVFDVFKFRTMKTNDSLDQKIKQATRDDPRTTRVGRFLRRSSLDELPQLFNVLLGDMSIVGPRPHAVQHNMEYSSIISEYFARHNVKPGITGWAQINGYRGEINTPEKMQKRIDADLFYIENWSLQLDIKIISMTAIVVWFQKEAY